MSKHQFPIFITTGSDTAQGWSADDPRNRRHEMKLPNDYNEIHVPITSDTRFILRDDGSSFSIFVEGPSDSLVRAWDWSDFDNSEGVSVRICSDLVGDELIEVAVKMIQFVGALHTDEDDLVAHVAAKIRQGFRS